MLPGLLVWPTPSTTTTSFMEIVQIIAALALYTNPNPLVPEHEKILLFLARLA